jgi:hypothetical protein
MELIDHFSGGKLPLGSVLAAYICALRFCTFLTKMWGRAGMAISESSVFLVSPRVVARMFGMGVAGNYSGSSARLFRRLPTQQSCICCPLR